MGSVSDQGTKILHAARCSQKKGGWGRGEELYLQLMSLVMTEWIGEYEGALSKSRSSDTVRDACDGSWQGV